MIKLIGVPGRKSGWSEREFYAHYFERHGPLAASVKEYGKYAGKYTQNYATMRDVHPAISHHATDREGLSEIWFEDVAGLIAAYKEPEYTRVLRTDELRFVSLESIMVAVCREHDLYKKSPDAVADKAWAYECRNRLFCFRAPAMGADMAEFQTSWLAAAPSIVESEPFRRFVCRYTQSHVERVDAGLPGDCQFGVVDEYWFDSDQDAVDFWRAYCDSKELARLDKAHTDPERLQVLFARAHVVYGA
jgi:hypothetical protein